MTIHLPEDLEQYLQSQVQNGYFTSADAAITEAVRLLRQVRPSAPLQGKWCNPASWPPCPPLRRPRPHGISGPSPSRGSRFRRP